MEHLLSQEWLVIWGPAQFHAQQPSKALSKGHFEHAFARP